MSDLAKYTYLRCLQLEGRFPHDAGGWQITLQRLAFGWGIPYSEDVPAIHFSKEAPLPEPPRLDPSSLKQNRTSFYQVIRNSKDCSKLLSMDPTNTAIIPVPSAAFEIGGEWAEPPQGILPTPNASPPPIASHSVAIVKKLKIANNFVFRNTWGSWGDNGYGQMPIEYFDARLIESWATGVTYHHGPRVQDLGHGINLFHWEARGIWNEPLHTFVVYDTAEDERMGWAFVLMRNDSLDIEEFYVRPEYRRRGYAGELSRRIREFARGKNRPLRLWVPFADCGRENPENYEALKKTVGKLGLSFRKSDVRWAAYLATVGGGSTAPIEPDHIPPRPTSALETILAALAAGLIGESGSTDADRPQLQATSVSSPAEQPRDSRGDAGALQTDGDEEDDGADFERDMDYIMAKNAELYRRLAR